MSNEKLIAILAARVAERIEQRLQELAQDNSKVRPRLLTAAQAAEYLGRSKAALHHLVAKKSVPVVRVGRRTPFDRCDLDVWILKNRSK